MPRTCLKKRKTEAVTKNMNMNGKRGRGRGRPKKRLFEVIECEIMRMTVVCEEDRGC